ncbi:DUF2935 domain-containing protein [Salinithrix halophila]|uniref:DUF2935 domain-containing protein n=1 Tax=Salinithrix halophila TaxID=1485204 RepID=A0ABV8JDG9_9BACL
MKLSVWEEHRFWLEILEDHARFVFEFLSPDEKEWIEQARTYMHSFKTLRQHLQEIDRNASPSSPEMIRFAKEAQPVASGYYRLECMIQSLRIQNQIIINTTPTYFNGTLAENGEYLRLLSYYVHGLEAPPLPLAELLELWLIDQLGHALLLISHIDPVEVGVKVQAERFQAVFQTFLNQNRVLTGYMRTQSPGFPRQMKLAAEVGVQVVQFYAFIYQVVRDYQNEMLMNKTTLRFLEHHFPEACYFLIKLSLYIPGIQLPANCSLTKPHRFPTV